MTGRFSGFTVRSSPSQNDEYVLVQFETQEISRSLEYYDDLIREGLMKFLAAVLASMLWLGGNCIATADDGAKTSPSENAPVESAPGSEAPAVSEPAKQDDKAPEPAASDLKKEESKEKPKKEAKKCRGRKEKKSENKGS